MPRAVALRIAVAFALGASFASLASDADAQCGATTSSCRLCHDGRRAEAPADAPWHRDHAFTDLCVGCHAGDGAAREEAAAHATRVDPLEDVAFACVPCHADADARAEAYREKKRATAAFSPPTRPPRGPHGSPLPNVVGMLVVLGVGFLGAGFVAASELRRPYRPRGIHASA